MAQEQEQLVHHQLRRTFVTVGNHQARYSGAPDNPMSGSSRVQPMTAALNLILSLLADMFGLVVRKKHKTLVQVGNRPGTLEYTGTSMATPNAAGAATLIREYLIEIASVHRLKVPLLRHFSFLVQQTSTPETFRTTMKAGAESISKKRLLHLKGGEYGLMTAPY